MRRSRPGYGLDFQVNVLRTLLGVASALGSGGRQPRKVDINKATGKSEFKLMALEAGPPNHIDG